MIIRILRRFILGSLFLNLSLIPIFDICASFSDFAGRLGAINWYLTYFFVFIAAFLAIKNIISMSFFHKKFIAILMLTYLLIIIGVNITRPENVSGETTNEISCILTHLKSPDLGYLKSCLYGYPSRQFYLPALPSLIFGRTIGALNSGIGIYVAIGLILFTAGLMKQEKFTYKADLFVATILALLMHFYYFNHFLFFFEQSIIPISFGLMATGLWLSYRKNYSLFYLGMLGIIANYLIYSYTPSLALYILMLLSGIAILFKKEIMTKQKIIIGAMLVMSFASLFISLSNRADIAIFGQDRTHQELITDIGKGVSHLILQSEGNPFINPAVFGIFLFILFGSIIGLYGRTFFFLGLWTIGVIFFAVLSRGYSYYGIDFRFHRSLVVVPIFLYLCNSLLNRLRNNEILNSPKLLFGMFAFVFITGVFFQQSFLNNKRIFKLDSLEDTRHTVFIRWFTQRSRSDLYGLKTKIYFSENLKNEYLSLNDRLHYFMPLGQSDILSKDCQFNQENEAIIYMVLSDSSICRDKRLSYIDGFSFNEDPYVKLYILSK